MYEWGHPFEHELFDAPPPARLCVLTPDGKRAAALKSAGKKMGVKVTDIYWTLGDHDGVLIFEAPDDEARRH